MRCEKKPRGRCSMWRMKRDEDTTAILPRMRTRYTSLRTDATQCTTVTINMQISIDRSHSGFLSDRMRSTKTCLIDVMAIPASEAMAADSMTKTMGALMPESRSIA